MHIVRLLELVFRDLRLASRRLLRRPAFTLAAVGALALGIGATIAIFGVVYSVLIKPLSYPNADELVRIRHSAPGTNTENLSASSNMYLTYREANRTFASIGLWQETSATLAYNDVVERVRALRVTDGTLQALGVQPMHGRWFLEAEHDAATTGPAPVILSYAFWQRQFGGDEAALSQELTVESPSGNGALPLPDTMRVVGIMPPDFTFLDSAAQPDIIVPVRLDPAQQVHGIWAWQMLGRLNTGTTLAEARADLERIAPIWLDAWPPFPGMTREDFAEMQITAAVRPLQDDMVGDVARLLWVFLGAVGAVLLIACTNVANLMLVRADARRPELSMRAALGAGRARIAGELLAESFILGAAGAALGFMLAYFSSLALVAAGLDEVPRLREVAIYPPVVLFTIILSITSTLFFGSIAALKHAVHSLDFMVNSARGAIADRGGGTARSTLVVVQVALALVLVVGAALMIRSFQLLRDVDPGFTDAASVQTARIWIPTALFPNPEQYTRMQHEISDRIAELPGVTSVGFASEIPIEYAGMGINFVADGQSWEDGRQPQTRLKFVSPGYFETMGTRIIAGRELSWSDIETGGMGAVISERFARELAAEPSDAIGMRVRFEPFGEDPWREVVGVVQNIYEDGLYVPPPSMVYWPVLASNTFEDPVIGTPSATFVIRSDRAGTASLIEEIRGAIESVSGSIPIAQERTLQDLYAAALARTSVSLIMLATAGGMALLLGVIGIYGVIAYVVSQRAREIGIRSALGAEPRRLMNMFLLHGLILSGIGIAIGTVVAMALESSMSSLLFGIESVDPAAYAGAIAVILVAAALASYLPARRAATIDPMETLRAE